MARRLASRRWSTVGAVVMSGAMALLAPACGGDDGGDVAGDGGSGGKPSSGGAGGTGGVGVGGSGGTSTSCASDTDCASGQFCSAAKTCVLIGGCGADADCQSGEKCSTLKKCIPTGTCEADGDCDAGLVCDTSTKSCVPGGGCGAEEFAIEAVASNMFISLDRSCSMKNGGGGGKSKWQISVEALNQMTTAFSGKIRWGLGLFPDITGDKCTQDASAFAVADNNESAIQGLLSAALKATDKNYPDGPCVTNIDTAMLQASQEPAFSDKTRKSYVLLITDGAQAGCNAAGGDAGTTKIITDLNTAGVSTFVVGFGNNVDAAQLNIFATAGGVPNNDPAAPNTKFYKANDQASLQAALAKIAGSIVGCSFVLAKTPPDPSKLYVFFDNAKVPRDPSHTSGWDYDATTNQLTFYGGDCDKVKANQVTDIDVVFGCDQPTPN